MEKDKNSNENSKKRRNACQWLLLENGVAGPIHSTLIIHAAI